MTNKSIERAAKQPREDQKKRDRKRGCTSPVKMLFFAFKAETRARQVGQIKIHRFVASNNLDANNKNDNQQRSRVAGRRREPNLRRRSE